MTGGQPSGAPSGDLRGLVAAAGSRPFWFPVGQGLAIGIVFIAVYLAAFGSPQPHHVRVAVAPGRAAAAVARQAAAAEPGGWEFILAPSSAAAFAAVTQHRAYAALAGGPTAVLVLAGANGPSVTAQLTGRLGAAAAQARDELTVRDVVPLPAGDSAGLVLFYITFGSVLAAYLFAIAATTAGASLTPQQHWLASVVFSVLLGSAEILLAGPAFGAITGDWPAVFGLVVLLLAAVSGTAAMLLSISRAFGAMIGTVILLTIGAASGGQLPAPFLPIWLAPGAYALPNGLAINGLRAVVYFHGASVGTAFLGLALWAVVPVALIEFATRLHRRPGRAETMPVNSFPHSPGSGGNTA